MQTKIYSVKNFCATHGISRNLFYTLIKEGKAPKMIKAGKRRLISEEAAAEWRREMGSHSHD
jgi:predicted DNA-binding transcriptional regulator AlpA